MLVLAIVLLILGVVVLMCSADFEEKKQFSEGGLSVAVVLLFIGGMFLYYSGENATIGSPVSIENLTEHEVYQVREVVSYKNHQTAVVLIDRLGDPKLCDWNNGELESAIPLGIVKVVKMEN